jgi:hypothetical protein
MTESIPLTAEQAASLRSTESDWLKMTKEQEQFIRSTKPGWVCTIYGDELLRVSCSQMERAMEVAFKTACTAALQLLGSSIEDVQITCDNLELGQTYLRVHATDGLGKTTSAIGMIPDPRAH